MRNTFVWKTWVVTLLVVTVASVEAIVGVVRGQYYARLLNGDCETGQRCTHFDLLYNSGAMGRFYARNYAGKRFKSWAEYGVHFVLRHRDLWIGMRRDEFLKIVGVPDKSDARCDTWYLARKRLLSWHKEKPSVCQWMDWWSEWFNTFVVEYDNGNRIVRLGMPGTTIPADSGQPTSMLPLARSERPNEMPPPPPEWNGIPGTVTECEE